MEVDTHPPMSQNENGSKVDAAMSHFSVQSANEGKGSNPQNNQISRRELLDIIRKHSDSLGRQFIAEMAVKDSEDPEKELEEIHRTLSSVNYITDDRYWKHMLQLYFMGRYDKDSDDEDFLYRDMLFFVRSEQFMKSRYCYLPPSVLQRKPPSLFSFASSLLSSHPSSTENDKKPYFVKDNMGYEIDPLISEQAEEIDWRLSFYLNLLCHTNYTLTLAVVSRKALEEHRRSGSSSVPPIHKITRKVYASPCKAGFNKQMLRSGDFSPAASYPYISFSILEDSELLKTLVMADLDHCFCVLLNAHGGAAFPPQDGVVQAVKDGKPKRILGERGGAGGAERESGREAEGGKRSDEKDRDARAGEEKGDEKTGEDSGGVTGKKGGGGEREEEKEKLWVRGTSTEVKALGEEEEGKAKITLFSGFVSYPMVSRAVFGDVPMNVWGGVEGPKPEALIMRGPNGKGEAHVSISVTPPKPTPLHPLPPLHSSSKPPLSPKPGMRTKSPQAGTKGSSPSLELLQQRLVSAQENLMQVVSEQTKLSSGLVTDLTPEQKAERENENQRKLAHLQVELKEVQEQLQRLQREEKAKPGSKHTHHPPSSTASGFEWLVNEEAGEFLENKTFKKQLKKNLAHSRRVDLPEPEPEPEESVPVPGLGCSLLTLTLPWELLAFDLLFKEMPIKVDIGGRIFPPKRPAMEHEYK